MSINPPPPESNADLPSLRAFLHQRQTQMIGAGIIVLLIIGAIFGWVFQRDTEQPAKDSSVPLFTEQVIYIAPANSPIRNLYLYDLGTGETRQLTDLEQGIEETFTISPDGQKVAFASPANSDEFRLEIWLVEVGSGKVTQITRCAAANASCYDPAWHPSGDFVGFTREEKEVEIEAVNRKRAWIVDIETLEPALLFSDTSIIGHSPRWGGDGSRVALVSANPPGILIYDYTTQESELISTEQDVMGVFSPDGNIFIYPKIVQGVAGSTYYSQIALLNFTTGVDVDISGGFQSPAEDIQAAFKPDGNYLGVVRRYLDNRYTNGGQLYQIDLETGDVQPILVDGEYSHGSLGWNGTGDKITYQRFDFNAQLVSVWVYDFATQEAQMIAEDAMLPKFLP